MADVAADLQKSRELLAVPGVWAKGADRTYPGSLCRLCLVDAISVATEVEDTALRNQRFFEATLPVKKALGWDGYSSLSRFNDDDGTDLADVLSLLDKAIVNV